MVELAKGSESINAFLDQRLREIEKAHGFHGRTLADALLKSFAANSSTDTNKDSRITLDLVSKIGSGELLFENRNGFSTFRWQGKDRSPHDLYWCYLSVPDQEGLHVQASNRKSKIEVVDSRLSEDIIRVASGIHRLIMHGPVINESKPLLQDKMGYLRLRSHLRRTCINVSEYLFPKARNSES